MHACHAAASEQTYSQQTAFSYLVSVNLVSCGGDVSQTVYMELLFLSHVVLSHVVCGVIGQQKIIKLLHWLSHLVYQLT